VAGRERLRSAAFGGTELAPVVSFLEWRLVVATAARQLSSTVRPRHSMSRVPTHLDPIAPRRRGYRRIVEPLAAPLIAVWVVVLPTALPSLGLTVSPVHPVVWMPLVVGLVYFVTADVLDYQHLKKYRCLVCPNCWYALRGLGEWGACPECGQSFSAQEVTRSWMDHYGKNTAVVLRRGLTRRCS
jgi:hypothetical protein